MINRQNSSAFEPRTRAVQKFSDNLSQKDRRDPFRITIGSRSSLNATLGGIKSGANVDLKLLNRSGQVIASSKNKGNKRERIQVGSLEQGVYRLVAELKGKVATKFNLRATTTAIATPNPNPNPSPIPSPNPSPNPSPLPSPNPSPNPNPSPSPAPAPVPVPTPVPTDLAGQTRATARDISFGQDYEDFVGAVDTQDFYKFTLDGATSNLPKRLLTGSIGAKSGGTLGGSVTVSLFKDGQTTALKSKVISGAGGSLFDNDTEQLDSGDYFVEITSSDPAVDYKFSLNSAVPDNGGNIGSARTITLPDNTSEFVGAGDTDDVYEFASVGGGQVVRINLTRTENTSPLTMTLITPDGNMLEEVTLAAGAGADPVNDYISRDLVAAGNYQIRLNDNSAAGTNYNIEYFFL